MARSGWAAVESSAGPLDVYTPTLMPRHAPNTSPRNEATDRSIEEAGEGREGQGPLIYKSQQWSHVPRDPRRAGACGNEVKWQ